MDTAGRARGAKRHLLELGGRRNGFRAPVRGRCSKEACDVQALVRSLFRPLPRITALFPMLWYAAYAAIERAAKISAYSVNVWPRGLSRIQIYDLHRRAFTRLDLRSHILIFVFDINPSQRRPLLLT